MRPPLSNNQEYLILHLVRQVYLPQLQTPYPSCHLFGLHGVQHISEFLNFLLIVLGDKYHHWTDKLKGSQRICLLGLKENVGDYMAAADYYVMSSDWEGLPITLLEAMSMGVIPVSTPAGGVADVIKDGTNIIDL